MSGALANLDLILNERFQRLEKLGEQAEPAPFTFSKGWKEDVDSMASASLMTEIEAANKNDYITAIQGLGAGARAAARAWLQSIVDGTENLWR